MRITTEYINKVVIGSYSVTAPLNNRMQVFTAVVNRVIVFRVVPRPSGLLGS
jgi:hypothetical protein